MSARDFPLLWSNPQGIPPQSALLVYLCIGNNKDTNTHSFPVALQYDDSARSPYCIYLIIILRPHTCLSVWLENIPGRFGHHLCIHIYVHVYYAFMLNTKTCIMKAADLSCSSGLHSSRCTILSQPSEPKSVRTWQYVIFIAWVKRVRKDDTAMNLNSQFNSTVKCFFFFSFIYVSQNVKLLQLSWSLLPFLLKGHPEQSAIWIN